MTFLPLQNYVSDVLIPYGAIQDRIEKLASDILSDYRGKTPLLLCILKVCILNCF